MYYRYMKAVWNNTVIAEAAEQDLIKLEDSWYFPPESLANEYIKPNYQTAHSKYGMISYYDIKVGEQFNPAAAWYFHEPSDEAIAQVGKDFTDYVAFWQGVEIYG